MQFFASSTDTKSIFFVTDGLGAASEETPHRYRWSQVERVAYTEGYRCAPVNPNIIQLNIRGISFILIDSLIKIDIFGVVESGRSR